MESVRSSTVMDIFCTNFCICSCFKPFRYRLITCFEFSFVDQICMYQHAVHFIISERSENKLNITVTKNLFTKNWVFWGMTLCCWVIFWNIGNQSPIDTVTFLIKHQFSATLQWESWAARLWEPQISQFCTYFFAILCFMTQMHSICLLLGVSVSKSSDKFFLLFCQRKF